MLTVTRSTVTGESPHKRVSNSTGGKMAVVNKEELARDVSARTGIEIGQSKLAVEATLEAIAKQVGDGHEVRLTGFGKIAAKRVPKFSPGAELKKAVQ
jgi:nucleoid DNA-binding protein